MKTFSRILLVSVLAIACAEAKKKEEQANKAPARTSTGAATSSATSTTIDWSAPLRKVEVKAYHILPQDKGEKLSGYCIATSNKPNIPKVAEEHIKTGEGPCPDSMDLGGDEAEIAYVCPSHKTENDEHSQTILYEKIKTGQGYESIKKVGPAIVNGFCDRSNVL